MAHALGHAVPLPGPGGEPGVHVAPASGLQSQIHLAALMGFVYFAICVVAFARPPRGRRKLWSRQYLMTRGPASLWAIAVVRPGVLLAAGWAGAIAFLVWGPAVQSIALVAHPWLAPVLLGAGVLLVAGVVAWRWRTGDVVSEPAGDGDA